MFQIRRVLVSRIGHAEAWYDGVVIPFVNEYTGTPTSTVISLTNGGGKSTLAALIANVFVPAKNRFIQKLQKGYEFNDYFRAVPGVIAIELESPADDLLGTPQRLIAGQAVINRGTQGTEREFFLFLERSELDFDHLPFRGAPASGEEIEQWEEVRGWLRRMQESVPGFRYTSSQTQWQEQLEAAGLDPWLIDSQINMNVVEGGMDAFAQFGTEERFLYRFFEMVGQPQGGNEVCESLNSTMSERRRYTNRKRQAELLAELHGALEAFDRTARRVRDNAAAEQDAAAQITATRQGVMQRLSAEENAQAQHRATIDRRKPELEAARKEVTALHQHYCRAALLRWSLERQEAQARERLADRDVAGATRRLQALQAAELLARYRGIEQRLNDQRGLLEAENREIRPLEANLREAGSRVRRALRSQREAARERARNYRDQAQWAGSRIQESESEQERIRLDAGKLNRLAARLEERLDQYRRHLESLRADGVIGDSEVAGDAEARLADEIERIDAAIAEVSATEQRLNAEWRQASEVERDRQAKLNRAEGASEAASAEAAAGDQAREALLADPRIPELTGRQAIEPDDAELREHIETILWQRRREQQHLEQDRERLERDVEHIAAHGLAPGDPDAQRAREMLEQKGFVGVHDYAEYLASGVARDAEHARAIVRSDPARFLGLYVHDPEELARIRALDLAPEGLSKPVVISLPTDHFEAQAEARAVLGPDHDARYDYQAAARLKENFHAEIGRLTERLRALNESVAELSSLLEALQRYARNYGDGALQRLHEAKAAAAAQCERAATALDQAKQAREGIEASMQEQMEERERLREARLQPDRQYQRVRQFRRDHESGFEENARELERTRKKIEGFEQSLRDLLRQDRELAQKRDEANEKARDEDGKARTLDERVAAYGTYLDDEADLAEESLDLEGLEVLYREREQVLEQARQERGLGDLSASVGRLSRERQEAYRNYTRKRGESITDTEVEPLLALDREAEAEAAGQKRDAAIAEQTEARMAVRRIEDEEIPDFCQREGIQASDFADSTPAPEDDLASLRERQHSAQDRLERAREQTEQLEQALNDARQAEEQGGARIKRLGNLLRRLPEPAHTTATAPRSFRDQPIDEVEAAADEAQAAYLKASEAEKRAEEDAAREFVAVKKCLDTPDFREHEPRLHENLTNIGGRIRSVCEQSAQFVADTEDRWRAVESALARSERNLSTLINRLSSHINQSASLLAQACRQRIPENVPHFGGMRILSTRLKLNSIDGETRRKAIDAYIRRLTAANEQRHDLAQLSSELIGELAEAHHGSRHLGIRLLKCNIGNPHSVPVTESMGSGGQALTSAMLLYMMLCQLRARQRGQSDGSRQGGFGFLLQDNPIGKASSIGLIKAQVSMAEKFGIQLLFLTAILDYDAMSELPHVVRVRKNRIDPRTKLQPVEVAHWSFPRGEMAEAENA